MHVKIGNCENLSATKYYPYSSRRKLGYNIFRILLNFACWDYSAFRTLKAFWE